MNDQFQLWLIPPMLTAALSFWFRRKLTLAFSWPLLLQSIFIITCGAVGLLIGPKPVWTLITWVLFFLFLILPNLYLRQCEQYYSALNVNGLLGATRKIPIFYWGKLGEFWCDIYNSYAKFMTNDEEQGNKILARWKTESLPKYFHEQLDATELAAAGLLWHWDAIIEEFHKRPANTRTASLCFQASRAFAETGQFELATQCLRATNLPNQRMGARPLALTYLQYFALVGAQDQARKIINILEHDKNPPPKVMTDVWWARCLSMCGEKEQSLQILQKQLTDLRGSNVPRGFDTSVWIPRLERQLALAESRVLPARSPEEEQNISKNIEIIWQNYQDALSVQQIVLPRQSSRAVNVLLVLMVTGYLLSGCIDLLDNPLVASVLGSNSSLLASACTQGLWMTKQFYLEKDLVMGGQYYRLVSYLFLHGNLSHLLLNAVGLVWFGRIAASIYGEVRLVIIFIVSGIVGGLAQIIFTDTSAVGASGAIFGIFAAVVVAIFKLRDVLPEQMRKRELRWMILMTIAQVCLDRIIPRVAGLAHLGGIVGGIILGFLLLPKQSQKTVQADKPEDETQEGQFRGINQNKWLHPPANLLSILLSILVSILLCMLILSFYTPTRSL